MSNGLLAEWRRGIVARGLAGAALLAVPVGVAAAIGFGTSLSGVTGGLSSLANGPDSTAAAPTGPGNLAPAVVALSGPTGGNGGAPNGGGGNAGGGAGGIGGTGSGSGSQTGSSGPSVPDVNLPTGGNTGSTTNNPQGAVNNVINGVNSTVGQVIGGH
jgi:hypothetical protein